MKDFDAQRHEREANTDGRSFTIGGQELTARASVNPDVWIDYFDRRRNTQWESNRDYLEFLDAHIRAVLEPESADRWQHVREHADPAITLADIDAVVDFLWETQSSRPPTQPTGSSNGSDSEPSGTSSTDASSSPREEALTG